MTRCWASAAGISSARATPSSPPQPKGPKEKMMEFSDRTIVVNGRDYRAPSRNTVVICLDGSEPGYIEEAIKAGVAPTFARFMKDGAHVHANSVIPSFTNPNNLSIITGRPPSGHGI